MSDPREILTDEFIERVARQIARECSCHAPIGTFDAVFANVQSALKAEREPVHILRFEVRASTRQAAIEKFSRYAEQGRLWAQEDITLVDPTERTS